MSPCLNASISSHNRISFVKQFHARGPHTTNARLPPKYRAWISEPSEHCFIESHGIASAFWLGDHFLNAVLPRNHLKTMNSVLNSIRYLTESQWSVTIAGIMRLYFLKLKTRLAAVSCARWSLLMRFSDSPFMKLPDSKVHGANMGPIWGRQDPGGPHVGPMNFAIWASCCTIQSGLWWMHV